MLPYLSISELRQSVQEKSDRFNADIGNLLPEWARGDARDLFKDHRFIVCGSVCMSEVRVLSRLGKVLGVVDDFLCKEKAHIDGIPVMSSDAWIDRVRRDPRVITCVLVPGARAFQFFMRLCMQWQVKHLDPLQFVHLIKQSEIDTAGETGRFFWYGHEFFTDVLQNSDKLLRLCDHLEDDFSRISWLGILLYRMTLNPLYLDAIAVGHHFDRFGLNSYATNRQFLTFSDNEVFVDGGAFTGYMTEYFVRAVGGKFRQVHSFEPSQDRIPEIRERFKKVQGMYPGLPVLDRINLVEKGLWNTEGTLQFVPGQTIDGHDGSVINPQSAHILDTGLLEHIYDTASEQSNAIEVPVTTIDRATGEEATFIKMEIEGAELEALEGAAGTIQRNRPQMSLSIYHKPQDLVTITEFVLNTGLDYRLGFRQHNPLCPDATVLYCYR